VKRKLLYSPYSNITDDEYFELKEQLVPMEVAMANVLMPLDWQLSDRDEGYLIISYVINQSDIYGNFGMIFNSDKKEKVFSFCVTKSFDIGNVRYFIKSEIIEDRPIDFFVGHLNLIVNDALDTYNNWTKQHVMDYGEPLEMRP